MHRALVVVVVHLAFVGVASADRTHYGVGLGPAVITGDLAKHFTSEGQVGGRIYLGQRIGDWAIDGVFFGADLAPHARPDDGTHSTLALGVDVRRFVSLLPGVQAYVRGGVDYTWLARCHGDGLPVGYSGSGYHYGAGLEVAWRWRLPRRPGSKRRVDLVWSAWLDAGRQKLSIGKPGAKTLSGQIDQITLGMGVGFDY